MPRTSREDVTISEGSLTLSIVHPREVFIPAMRASAAGDFRSITIPAATLRRVRKTVSTVRLVCRGAPRHSGPDHVIVGDAGMSFADRMAFGAIRGQDWL